LEQKVWRIPSTKAGQPHLLPSPNAAVEILDTLPKTLTLVFPGKVQQDIWLSRRRRGSGFGSGPV
jgi:hypothetical protein